MRSRSGGEAAKHAISAARANASANAAARRIPVGIVSCSERVSSRCLLFTRIHPSSSRLESLSLCPPSLALTFPPKSWRRVAYTAWLIFYAHIPTQFSRTSALHPSPLTPTVYRALGQPPRSHLPSMPPSAHIRAFFSALPPLHSPARFARTSLDAHLLHHSCNR